MAKLHPKTLKTLTNFIEHELNTNHSHNYETGLTPSTLLEKFYKVPKKEREKYGWGHAWHNNITYRNIGRIINHMQGLVSERRYDPGYRQVTTKYYLSNSSK